MQFYRHDSYSVQPIAPVEDVFFGTLYIDFQNVNEIKIHLTHKRYHGKGSHRYAVMFASHVCPMSSSPIRISSTDFDLTVFIPECGLDSDDVS